MDNVAKSQELLREKMAKFAHLPDELKFLTYEEVAHIMRVQVQTVRKWVSTGALQNFPQGRRSTISIPELQRFVAERMTRSDEKKKSRLENTKKQQQNG